MPSYEYNPFLFTNLKTWHEDGYLSSAEWQGSKDTIFLYPEHCTTAQLPPGPSQY